jgi:hypothetical protein
MAPTGAKVISVYFTKNQIRYVPNRLFTAAFALLLLHDLFTLVITSIVVPLERQLQTSETTLEDNVQRVRQYEICSCDYYLVQWCVIWLPKYLWLFGCLALHIRSRHAHLAPALKFDTIASGLCLYHVVCLLLLHFVVIDF